MMVTQQSRVIRVSDKSLAPAKGYAHGSHTYSTQAEHTWERATGDDGRRIRYRERMVRRSFSSGFPHGGLTQGSARTGPALRRCAIVGSSSRGPEGPGPVTVRQPA